MRHILVQKKLEAFRHRHLFTVCKAFSTSTKYIDALAPCVPLQEGIISRSLGSNTNIYFEEFNLELSPTINIEKLKNAWIQVIASAPILRTRFCPTADGYAQVVCKQFQLPWHEKEFSSPEELDKLRSHQYHTWWTTNRELTGPLFEILVFHSQIKKFMCLHIFHALYDGQSILKIFRNVQLEYNQVPNVDYGPPYHKMLSYGPLLDVDGEEEFWRSCLKGLNYEPLPIFAPLPSQSINSITLKLSRLPMNNVRQHYSTTHQSLIQAAWTTVLRRHFPSQVSFGMVVSGRSIDFKEAHRVIGPLFNTIPFYIDIERCTSWSGIIGLCHEFNTMVLPYQNSSLRNIMKWCQRSQDCPLFETLFVFQKESADDFVDENQLWTQIDTIPKVDVSWTLFFKRI